MPVIRDLCILRLRFCDLTFNTRARAKRTLNNTNARFLEIHVKGIYSPASPRPNPRTLSLKIFESQSRAETRSHWKHRLYVTCSIYRWIIKKLSCQSLLVNFFNNHKSTIIINPPFSTAMCKSCKKFNIRYFSVMEEFKNVMT